MLAALAALKLVKWQTQTQFNLRGQRSIRKREIDTKRDPTENELISSDTVLFLEDKNKTKQSHGCMRTHRQPPARSGAHQRDQVEKLTQARDRWAAGRALHRRQEAWAEIYSAAGRPVPQPGCLTPTVHTGSRLHTGPRGTSSCGHPTILRPNKQYCKYAPSMKNRCCYLFFQTATYTLVGTSSRMDS